ncbi:MAG: DUF4833 domain-containing protein [Alphaproteobacteria bacterium]|nr:DUF4833 domain-containing protein [Alphaproteobacteria bacterium]
MTLPFHLVRQCGLVLTLAVALSLPVAATSISPRPDYPVPPDDAKRLFYLQRSSNANTVVYDARLTPDGRLDPERPVEVYWLRYNTNGKRRALNFIERHLAYGVEARPTGDDAFLVKLVSFSKRELKVFVDQKGKVRATTTIAGRPARLRFLFVEHKKDGLIPTIVHVDIFGEDLKTGAIIHERVVP